MDSMFRKIRIFLMVMAVSSLGLAQSFDASGVAMSGAYGALARGVDAVGWNPANLALPGGSRLQINLFSLHLILANNSLTPDDYNTYFTDQGHGGFWDEGEKNGLLGLIPNTGLEGFGNARANIFGLGLGPLVIAAQGYGNFRANLPKTPLEIFLKGNRLNKTYDFSDIEGSGFAAVKFSAAAGFQVPFKTYFDVFTVGLSLNYWMGLATAEITESNGQFITTREETMGQMRLEGRSATGGGGFGMDLGVAGIVNEKWTVGLSLQNIIGSINWNSNPEMFYTNVFLDSVGIDNLDSTSVTTEDSSGTTDAFNTAIPLVAHVGVAYQYSDNLLFSADVEQAFAKRLGFSNQGSLSFGVEYKPVSFIPLRSGITLGGRYGFSMGMGFGIHVGFFELDLAYSMQNALWPSYSKGVATAVDMKFSF